jgi:hypothetical protein
MNSSSAFDQPTPDDEDDVPAPESATAPATAPADVRPAAQPGTSDSESSVTAVVVPRMLASHEAAVRAALRTAMAGRDYTWPPLTDAVTSLGRAAQFAQASLDDLLAIVEVAVRSTLSGPRLKSTADAVLVYLHRFARQAYYGARVELLEAQAKRGPTGMR